MRTPYAALLDALGLFLEREEASDILIDELDGGFLVGYLANNEQRVATLTTADMTRLQSEAIRHKGGKGSGWTGMLGRRSALRMRLRALGALLDKRAAHAIVVQERAHGFSVEFTAVPYGPSDPTGLVRLHETFDEQQLAGA